MTEKNEWVDVKPREGSLIVNLGTLLTHMTGDRLKSTEHRVLAIGRERQSVPFFFEPSYHAKIPRSLPKNLSNITSVAECKDTFEYGPFMKKRIKQFIEYGDFLKDLETASDES